MHRFDVWIRKVAASNDPMEWTIAAGIAVGLLLLTWLSRRWVRGRYEKMAATEVIELMEVPFEVLSKTRFLFLLAVSLFAGLSTVTLPTKMWTITSHIVTAIVFWQVGVWGSASVVAWLHVRRKTAIATNQAAASSLGVIGFVIRVLVWTLVMLLALDNFGVDITALVAGLGVGGIAVALAVQSVLGDLFASMSIALDQPFVIGDFITVGDFAGNVEHIGVKSTRVRSISGEQIILANADLLGSRVRNYGRMQERRILFKLGVTYETSHELLKQIPDLIRTAIEAQENTRFDRSHFSNYGDFALEFESVYYVLSREYGTYMGIQQNIYFAIHSAFESAGIEFAYPTQKLWLAAETALKIAGSASDETSRPHVGK